MIHFQSQLKSVCVFTVAITLALPILGCSTQQREGSTIGTFELQNKSITPLNGGALVTELALEVGDILLTSTETIVSAGIQLGSLAPVSHAALYVGDGLVIEAVGKGVQTRKLNAVVIEEALVVAFRYPALNAEASGAVKNFATQQIGRPYNHVGIIMHAAFALERKLCELPLVPSVIRHACLTGLATIQMGAMRSDQFFCSQLVADAYRFAKVPLIDADPRFVSPSDLLHLREGDVSAMAPKVRLVYVGHLKLQPPGTLSTSEE